MENFTLMIKTLRSMYVKGKVSEADLKYMLDTKKITRDEYEYILRGEEE